jgi:hypothetical protein
VNSPTAKDKIASAKAWRDGLGTQRSVVKITITAGEKISAPVTSLEYCCRQKPVTVGKYCPDNLLVDDAPSVRKTKSRGEYRKRGHILSWRK